MLQSNQLLENYLTTSYKIYHYVSGDLFSFPIDSARKSPEESGTAICGFIGGEERNVEESRGREGAN